MDKLQFEGGFTRIPNQILQSMMTAKLNGTQRAIIDCVWRQTYGYNRRAYKLSESFIAKATDISQRNIRRELANLLKANILITVEEPTYRTPRVIAFNSSCTEWHTVTRQSKRRQKDAPAVLE